MKAKYDYGGLRRKIFSRGVIITAGAVIAVLVLRALSYGRLADGIVVWIERTFSMTSREAINLYQLIIPANLEYLMALIIIAFMLFLFGMLLKSYTKYFDEVIAGIDKIMGSEQESITLSPELDFVEKKLNNVKHTLDRRASEAQRAEQQKNDLVVYLAHDIKTPLTSVLGYLSLLDETPDLPDEQKAKYIHIAFEKANRLETLVNEFFDITRHNLQTVPLNKESIDLCYMMMQISDELYPGLTAHEKEIRVDIEANITVSGDGEKLARVFNNILKNAIAYSNDKSLISVTAEKNSGKAILRFESEGAIPQDKLEVIFDKFNRLNAARSSDTGGSGLGLAIAKDIVTAHGGTIRAESNDTHTIFIVELPSASS